MRFHQISEEVTDDLHERSAFSLCSGRVYLEWARLVAPVRRSMDLVYDESMEVELHDE
jgi:hypothetical protein